MSLSSEKLQLEKEIEQLVQNNPTPKFLGAKIDSNLRSTLQSWAAQRKILAEKRERLEMILEEERIQEILRELEELHPQKKHECAICLEDVTDSRRCVLGQGTCAECLGRHAQSAPKRTSRVMNESKLSVVHSAGTKILVESVRNGWTMC